MVEWLESGKSGGFPRSGLEITCNVIVRAQLKRR
jgi:hypothetical protein